MPIENWSNVFEFISANELKNRAELQKLFGLMTYDDVFEPVSLKIYFIHKIGSNLRTPSQLIIQPD